MPGPRSSVGVSASSGVIVALMSDVGVLMTTEEAADKCGVRPGTIRQWVRRGHLKAVGRTPGGRSALYRQVDVAAAEAATRARAKRSPGLDRLCAELARVRARLDHAA